ncbi:MAG: SGNH/GDSL hydrolase family protein [Pirellula sp.]|nr:SGNH/GDSL hydrolase family protein [Pirellula sp.]
MKPNLTILTALLLAQLATLHAAESSAQSKPVPDPALTPIEDVAGLPRVLLIGDSVSIGYTLPTRELLKGKANVHRPPTNCSSTGHGLNYLKSWLGDKKWDVIHFNFGLHDAKLPPEGVRHAAPEMYEKNLRELVIQMKATSAKLIFATTTPVPNGGNLRPTRRFGSVDQYNAVARKVMTENGVAINDLNADIAPHVEKMQRANDVHFTDEGSMLLAKQVVKAIEAQLGLGTRTRVGRQAARLPNVITMTQAAFDRAIAFARMRTSRFISMSGRPCRTRRCGRSLACANPTENRLHASALEWVQSLPPAELRTAVANGADRMKLLDIQKPRTSLES